ncbi:Uncharacterised protein [Shigella flexneri]|nr:Uncharacterised protein [Shigella flexneri]
MAEQSMILVTGELLCREFPVTVDHPLLYAADNFGAAFATIQHAIQIPGNVTQVIMQARCAGIPVAKNQSFITLHTRNFV